MKLANAGGYKHGGKTSKHYASGGGVNEMGNAMKMPVRVKHGPVANTLQSGTYARGGKVDEEKPNLRLVKTHTGPHGHVAKIYKDRDYGEHRVRFYDPEGKHHHKADYHTDDVQDAHDTAMYELNRATDWKKSK